MATDRELQIKARLAELDRERQVLLDELANLQTPSNRVSYGKPVLSEVPRTNDEKIALFLLLFGARTDVFPKRWENKNKGTKGYSPVCGNEWIDTVCLKPQRKCSECPNKNYLMMDKEVIRSHP